MFSQLRKTGLNSFVPGVQKPTATSSSSNIRRRTGNASTVEERLHASGITARCFLQCIAEFGETTLQRGTPPQPAAFAGKFFRNANRLTNFSC
jgi:hypothetical protein